METYGDLKRRKQMAKVYLFNDDGYFVGVGESIPHPFNLGEDSLPNNSTYLEVPEEKEGNLIRHYMAAGELPERWSYEKVLTEAEQKISGELSLVDGEYVENGELVTVEAPSILHTWNTETHTWDADPIKIERMKGELYNMTSCKRNDVLEKGWEFETGKIVKGRDKDLTRSHTLYTMVKDGLIDLTKTNVRWQYSNPGEEVNEKIETLERATAIFKAISAFILIVTGVDSALKTNILSLTTPEELLAFSIDETWEVVYTAAMESLI